MEIRVLLVADDQQTRKAYLQAVAESGASCETLQSLDGLQRALEETPFNGLLLDLPTLVRADAAAKKLVNEVQEIFPTVRLRWHSRRRQVGAIALGGYLDPDAPLADFIDRFCRPWHARPLRKKNRVTSHLSVLLSDHPDFPPETTEKTTTLNISTGGCFVISNAPRKVGSLSWVRIMELGDTAPLEVEVRIHRPWGNGIKIPGIGVSFLDLTPEQKKELLSLLEGKGHEQPD